MSLRTVLTVPSHVAERTVTDVSVLWSRGVYSETGIGHLVWGGGSGRTETRETAERGAWVSVKSLSTLVAELPSGVLLTVRTGPIVRITSCGVSVTETGSADRELSSAVGRASVARRASNEDL